MLLLLQKSNTKQVANKEVIVDADVKSAADVCECVYVCGGVCMLQRRCGSSLLDSSSIPSKVTERFGDTFAY